MSEIINFDQVKAANSLPSPKGVGLKVMQLCQQEEVSLQDLVKLLQSDPVLAGRIIRIANSLSRNRSRPIASVTKEVLILIGVHAVRQVVLGISLVTSCKDGACMNFDYARFWSHSVAMACAAQALSNVITVAPVAEMFTLGLLANIGRLGLASVRPQAYSALLAQHSSLPPHGLMQAETELFGFSHVSLAVAMLSDWQIPRLFVDAVAFHHAPEESPFADDSRNQRIVRMLHCAAMIADICIADEAVQADLCRRLFESGPSAGIGELAMASVVAQAAEDWIEWGEVLNLVTKPLPSLCLPDQPGA
jgi:HD-like signal output (HDOD) protein